MMTLLRCLLESVCSPTDLVVERFHLDASDAALRLADSSTLEVLVEELGRVTRRHLLITLREALGHLRVTLGSRRLTRVQVGAQVDRGSRGLRGRGGLGSVMSTRRHLLLLAGRRGTRGRLTARRRSRKGGYSSGSRKPTLRSRGGTGTALERIEKRGNPTRLELVDHTHESVQLLRGSTLEEVLENRTLLRVDSTTLSRRAEDPAGADEELRNGHAVAVIKITKTEDETAFEALVLERLVIDDLLGVLGEVGLRINDDLAVGTELEVHLLEGSLVVHLEGHLGIGALNDVAGVVAGVEEDTTELTGVLDSEAVHLVLALVLKDNLANSHVELRTATYVFLIAKAKVELPLSLVLLDFLLDVGDSLGQLKEGVGEATVVVVLEVRTSVLLRLRRRKLVLLRRVGGLKVVSFSVGNGNKNGGHQVTSFSRSLRFQKKDCETQGKLFFASHFRRCRCWIVA